MSEMEQFDATAVAITEDSILLEYEDDGEICEASFSLTEEQLSGAIDRSVHTKLDSGDGE